MADWFPDANCQLAFDGNEGSPIRLVKCGKKRTRTGLDQTAAINATEAAANDWINKVRLFDPN
jgi:hypothetical protein